MTDSRPGERLAMSVPPDGQGLDGGEDWDQDTPAGTCACPPAAPGWTASTICDNLGVEWICVQTQCIHWDIRGNTKEYDCVFTP